MNGDSSEITEAVMKALAVGTAGAVSFTDPVAGAAIAAGSEGITLAFRATGLALGELRLERANRLIKKAAENAGKSPEDFWKQICQSEKLLDAAFIALDAGSKTALKAKIDLYAKILADEISSTDEALEAVRIRLKTLSIIEKPHLEILHVIAGASPNIAPKDSNDLGWSNDNIAQALSSYELVLPALLEPMLSNGLIWNNGLGRYGYKAYWKLTELGEDCLRMLSGGNVAKATKILLRSHPSVTEPVRSIIQPMAKTDFNIVKLEIVDASGDPIKKPFRLKNGENVFRCYRFSSSRQPLRSLLTPCATYPDEQTCGDQASADPDYQLPRNRAHQVQWELILQFQPSSL